MSEINSNEIIRALECCKTTTPEDCIECPYRNKGNSLYTGCVNTLVKDALSLIKELTAEYDSMAKSVNEASNLIRKLRSDKEKLTNAYKHLSEEYVKTLNHYFIDTTVGSGTSRQKCIEETVQNYRESLHREFASLGAKDKFNKEFFLTKADEIANELIAEGKND